jgi:hypothetical protein
MGRGRLVIVVVAASAAALVSTVGSVAWAEVPPVPPAAQTLDTRAASVAVDLMRTDRALQEVDRRLSITQQELASAQSTVDATDAAIAVNQSRVARRGNQVLKSMDLLQRARAMRADARDTLAVSVAGLTQSDTQLRESKHQEEAQLDQWGAVPVMGDSFLTAAQLATWYRATNATPKLAPGTTIDDLARMYIQEGEAEGVRGDIAFAQGVIESAYFSVAAGNNYAGIGACDSCSRGYAFANPREGVRAQIQLLRNYADPDSRAGDLAYRPVPGLYPGSLSEASRVFDTFFLKGKVPLWNQMGNGNWATDPTYATKVVDLYARMIAAFTHQ